MAAVLTAAKESAHVFPLAALCLFAEKPHPGHHAPSSTFRPGALLAISNTATGMPVCLYDSGIRSCCSSKERDAETGLDFFGARFMSSTQGRFTTPDELSSGVGGAYEMGGYRSVEPRPLPYADMMNPQSLGKYTYALNNPLRYVDPDGHCVFGIDTVWCVVGGIVAGAEALNMGLDLWEAKNNFDDMYAFGEYVESLKAQAITVCSAGKSECGAAVEAYQRASIAYLKKQAKTAKSAGTAVPGTTASGPLPTSHTDLQTNFVIRILTIPLDYSNEQQNKQKPTEPLSEPDARPRPKPDCLRDRDGNCVN